MLDVNANRQSKKWSRRVQLARVLWGVVQPAFRLSPKPLWGWRRFMLRSFGAKIGRQVHVHPNVRITMPWNLTIGAYVGIGDSVILYALGPITIGNNATLSQGAHICAGTHDISRPDRPLLKLQISVEDDAWVAADAFIGPGVTVGSGAIVGARGVVMKNVAPQTVVVGNPARPIRKL